MKDEIILYRYTIEKLIESYDRIIKVIKDPKDREYFIGKRSAFEDLLILFREDRTLSDLRGESFTPSDES